MREDSDFPQVPVKIAHIAEPKRYPVEEIEQCFSIDLNGYAKKYPFPQGGDDATKELKPHEIFEKMLSNGWKASMIGWARDDGHVNFGQAPTVNHRLVAVMVKLKAR